MFVRGLASTPATTASSLAATTALPLGGTTTALALELADLLRFTIALLTSARCPVQRIKCLTIKVAR